jgi:hypothetical protein
MALIKNLPERIMERKLGYTWHGEVDGISFFLDRKQPDGTMKAFNLRRLTLLDSLIKYRRETLRLVEHTVNLELIDVKIENLYEQHFMGDDEECLAG